MRRTRGRISADQLALAPDPAWSWLARPDVGGRRGVLVIAEDPVRGAILERIRATGYEALVAASLPEALEVLREHGPGIVRAFLASAPAWALGLRRVISDEHPEIQQVLLVA